MDWGCQFESIGIKLPEKKVTTRELVEKLKIPGFEKFGLLTGISERRACSDGENSFSLASDAARDCLSWSKYKADQIDMIINCSITKYRSGLSHLYEPSFSSLLKITIGAENAITFDISNACAGMMTGVYLASNYMRLGKIKTCMIVSGEYISNISDHALENIKTPLSTEIPSLTVGDCGAAVIIEKCSDRKKGLIFTGFKTISKYSKLCTGRQIRNLPGGKMNTLSKEIHQAGITESLPVVQEALEKSELNFSEIDFLIPHQTSRRSILSGANYLSENFGERPVNLVISLKDYGNTASTTHFLALYKYLIEGRFRINDHIMLICVASGLVVGVVLFKMNEMVNLYGNKN